MKAHRLSISRKILLAIVPLFLLFLFASVALYNEYQGREMMKQAQDAAHTYSDIIKEALVSMMVNNFEVDENFLTRINELPHFDTLHVLINDLRLRDVLLTEKRLKRLETKYKTLSPHDDVERQVLATGKPVFHLDGAHFRAVVPFNATQICQKCHNVEQGYTLGATDMHISLERIAEASTANWIRSLYIFISFTVVAIVFGSLMFRAIISRPVLKLVDATKVISEGDLDAPVFDRNEGSQDELAFLAEKFDEMRIGLKEKIEQLDQVNKSLAQRNRDVEEALRQLRAAEQELLRNERLAITGKMTAQLSHEINNPIHNIQSLLESSLKKMSTDNGGMEASGKARELIVVALEEVSRMARLTRQMLDLYRTSVVSFEKSFVDVRSVLEEIVKANKERLVENQISLRLDIPDSLPVIHGSHDKLKQVFTNLLSNARDAMPDGGVVTIGVRRDGGQVCIEVSDTGVGIPQEQIGKIFDAFFTTKKEMSGVGLGLSVSYAIIQQHGGTIDVQSTTGKGTKFTVRLPFPQEIETPGTPTPPLPKRGS
jgi:signal transduction histidine kinase